MHISYLTTALLCVLFPFTVASRLTVETTSGTAIGFSPTPNISAFFGIPYAAPPIDDLRFMPPQPARKSSKPINATSFGPICIQYAWKTPLSEFKPNRTESEDCLSLNIWVPSRRMKKAKVGKGLPSMVWLHGGAHSEGSGSDPRRFLRS